MGQSQDKGHPSNAPLPEPYSTVKPEIMNESEIHFEGPVDNAPQRSALKSYPSFERPAWQSSHYVDDHEYPGLDECTDQENSVSIIYPSSSASKPANHQSKLRRAVARLNICKLCNREPHLDLIESVPREALSCGHFVQEMQYRPRVEHSGGNIEASRAYRKVPARNIEGSETYQMVPESNPEEKLACPRCSILGHKVNGRDLIRCVICGTNCSGLHRETESRRQGPGIHPWTKNITIRDPGTDSYYEAIFGFGMLSI
ncbi:hypothetical protein CEP52_009213 [Fusarium oligoseptatum]|uniref:Uncharacterized protein n=1 Tax=Fusarium oligoseptatum TaxID=2604345 RepID=A0A428TE43_9HYPO|nr:hypothetical protein CEP52_009213 [Fusarium oligoseptatum]